MKTFYNSSGQALAYIDDERQSIYLYNGTPVGWIADDSVYAYSGRYLGWIENGWFYDRSGKPAFFTDNSSGGPARPALMLRPLRGVRGVRPVKGVREVRPARPARSLSWSQLSNDHYFSQ